VFLADEPMSDVEAMLWVLGLDPALRAAKAVGLGALRAEMYDRNLEVRGVYCLGGGVTVRLGGHEWQAGCPGDKPWLIDDSRAWPPKATKLLNKKLGWVSRRYSCDYMNRLVACTLADPGMQALCHAQVLQRMLGERYMYKHRVATGRHKGEHKALYIDMATPTKFSGTPLNTTGAPPPVDVAASDEQDAAEADGELQARGGSESAAATGAVGNYRENAAKGSGNGSGSDSSKGSRARGEGSMRRGGRKGEVAAVLSTSD
jgi:hypothetical protein